MAHTAPNSHLTVSMQKSETRRGISKSKHESATYSRTNLHGLSADPAIRLPRAGVRCTYTFPVGGSPSMLGVISNRTARNGEILAKLT